MRKIAVWRNTKNSLSRNKGEVKSQYRSKLEVLYAVIPAIDEKPPIPVLSNLNEYVK